MSTAKILHEIDGYKMYFNHGHIGILHSTKIFPLINLSDVSAIERVEKPSIDVYKIIFIIKEFEYALYIDDFFSVLQKIWQGGQVYA